MCRLRHNKLTALCLGILMTVLACPVAVMASADSWTVTYQPHNHTLAFGGSLVDDSFLLVRIVPFRDTQTILKEGAAAESEQDIAKTIERGQDNSIAASIQLPGAYVGSRYIYRANAGDVTKSGYLICADTSRVTAQLAAINSADAAGMKTALAALGPDTGVDNGDTQKDMDYLAKVLHAFRPSGGYTSESFLPAYMQAEAMTYIKQQTYTLRQVLQMYQVYWDKDYLADYEALGEAQQTSLEEQFRAGLTGGSFAQVFADNCFLAEFWNVDGTASLKTIVLDYFKEEGVSLTDYNRIDNEYKQETVFSKLYADRKSLTTAASVMARFDDLVEEALSSGGGGSGTGSGPSSGSSNGSGSGTHYESMGPGIVPPANTQQSAKFTDMTDHWARGAVEAMAERQVINGFDDGTFQPDENVTRAQFAKMLAVLLGLSEGPAHEFADVAPDSWYAPYVSMTAEAGIVLGSDGLFLPEEGITRQDAAVMIDRSLQYKQASPGGQPELRYTDADDVAEYAKEAVGKLSGGGLLTGADGLFRPKDNMNRAEAATLLWRVAGLIS